MIFNTIRLLSHHSELPRLINNCQAQKWIPSKCSHRQTYGNIHWRNFQGNSKGPTQKGGINKMRLAPKVEDGRVDIAGSRFGKLLKPIAFTAVFSCCSFAGAAIWQYETMRSYAINIYRNSQNWMRERQSTYKFGHWRKELHRHWCNFSEGQRLAFGIIGINTLVFLLWRVPRFQPMMMKYFCSNPAAKAVCWPMIMSTASHYSFWHLAINMYVLFTLSTSMVNVLGKEQFLAMYLSAGVVSSLASYAHKLFTLSPGVSLGASGCIMGALGFFCTQFPNAKMAIVFLPMFPFTADMALKGIIALDTAGVILGWKLFDHAAHLGGVCFGIGYAVWGRQYIWEKREPLQRWWHELRGEATK